MKNESPKLNLHTGYLLELSSIEDPRGTNGHREYMARFVKAGKVRAAGNRESNIEITSAAIQDAIIMGKFDQKAVFIDHAGWFQYPSLDNLIGVTYASEWNDLDQAAEGIIRLFNTPGGEVAAKLLDELLLDPTIKPDIGLSLVFYPVWNKDEESSTKQVSGITHIESIDLVFEPAAEGRVIQALSAFNIQPQPVGWVERQRNPTTPRKETNHMEEKVIYQTNPPPEPEKPTELNAWAYAAQESAVQLILQVSGLPQPSKDRLIKMHFSTPEDVTHAIEDERAYLAQLQESRVIQVGGTPPRSPQITGMITGLDQVQLALESLVSGVRPPDGIRPLTGIRELYHLLSGDYEMSGVYQPDRIMFSNVNSSTMASMVANVLNKRVVQEFSQYPQWWTPIVREDDFASLQAVRWNILGGIGELPTVAEGASYTELTWDDKYETASFVKKGGYLGITIEAIDKDETGRLRAAPGALAQAAWLTLSKAISYIFTQSSGAGPTLIDGTALFHSTRSNVGTTALSMASYIAARTAMRKFTELNSGERLGALVTPRYLLVPPDLEITALQILASEGYPGTANNDVNPLTQGDTFNQRMNYARERVIIVDLWTDTNDWAAVADPRLYPTIGIGYRYGRQPEIFSVASPTAGLMFTNDTLPIKVRFFYAVGPMDWRGMYKANVT